MVKTNTKILLVVIIALVISSIILIIIFVPRKADIDEVKWLADDRYNFVTFATQEEALQKSVEIGCTGFHTHEQEGETIFMACEKHSNLDPIVLGSTETQSGGTY